MGSIAVTAQPDLGRVRLDIDWTSHPSPRCLVYRVIPALYPAPVVVREGNPCVLSNSKATIYDVEGPLDVPTYYQAVVQLNDNADMESGVEEWTSNLTGGSAAQSTDFWYAGSASLLFTPDGATAAPQVNSDMFAVTVGASYTAIAQLLAAKTWSGGVGIVIKWYNAALTFLSTSGTAANLWPSVGQWEPYTITATAPATAAFARIGFLFAGTPPADRVFYIDEAYASTPLGTANSQSVILNGNPYFESPLNATGWAAVNGATMVANNGSAHEGLQSLQVTPDGVTAAPQVQDADVPVIVGRSYVLSGWIRSSTGTDVITLNISWRDASHALLSTSTITATPAAAVWTQYGPTVFVAPASTAFAHITSNITGTPANTHTWRLDELTITDMVPQGGGVVLSSARGGWWKDPLHPATMLRLQDQLAWACNGGVGVALVGVSRATRPADAAILDVPSQSVGVGSFSPRKAAQRTIQVATGAFPDADAVRDLHASNAPLLLQLPARYGVPEQYALYGNLTSQALGGDMARPFQVHQADFTHTQNPAGPAEGVLGTRYQDLRVKGVKLTYAAAVTAGYTWLDALKGNIA